MKRGRLQGDKKLDEKQTKDAVSKIVKNNSLKGSELKIPLRLSPSSKGLKAIRLTFPKGDSGYRGDKINDLLKKMI